jgi:DNA polymerase-3 subunit gamma/tau
MLGLSDRGAVRELLGRLLAGDALGALAGLKEQYELGVEPAALMRALLEAVHGITRAKIGGGRDPAQSAEEREAYSGWAERLSFPLLHRLWQLLLKGLDEVARAPLPLEAAEMALLRVIHASELPDPGQLASRIASGTVAIAAPAASTAPAGGAPLLQAPPSFADLVQRLAELSPLLGARLKDDIGLVRYAPPELVVKALRPGGDLLRELKQALKSFDIGEPWRVTESEETAEAPLREQEDAAKQQLEQEVLASPMVKAVFEAFPDAELAGYTAGQTRSR